MESDEWPALTPSSHVSHLSGILSASSDETQCAIQSIIPPVAKEADLSLLDTNLTLTGPAAAILASAPEQLRVPPPSTSSSGSRTAEHQRAAPTEQLPSPAPAQPAFAEDSAPPTGRKGRRRRKRRRHSSASGGDAGDVSSRPGSPSPTLQDRPAESTSLQLSGPPPVADTAPTTATGTSSHDATQASAALHRPVRTSAPSTEAPLPSPFHPDRYSADDAGPYDVFVDSPIGAIGHLHPMAVGRHLHRTRVSYSGVAACGRTRVRVSFSSAALANTFLETFDGSAEGWTARLPFSRRSCHGVIRGADRAATPNEFIEDSIADNGAAVTEARRLQRHTPDDRWVDTNTWRLTFVGAVLPSTVVLYGSLFEVQPYIGPVTQCRQCFRFGHSEKLCRSKARCPRCGSLDHNVDACEADARCVHCGGSHSATDRASCSRWTEERRIKTVMATERVSYASALRRTTSPQPPTVTGLRSPATPDPPVGLAPANGSPPPSPVSWLRTASSTTIETSRGTAEIVSPVPDVHTALSLLAPILSALVAFILPTCSPDSPPDAAAVHRVLLPLLSPRPPPAPNHVD